MIGFARGWGYAGLLVGNLFALRSTDPKALVAAKDPIGPENDKHLRQLAERATLIVAAWGNKGRILGRSAQVRAALGARAMCLGTTALGEPRHPLYVRRTTRPSQLVRVEEAPYGAQKSAV